VESPAIGGEARGGGSKGLRRSGERGGEAWAPVSPCGREERGGGAKREREGGGAA
jgi:hypothetical protein